MYVLMKTKYPGKFVIEIHKKLRNAKARCLYSWQMFVLILLRRWYQTRKFSTSYQFYSVYFIQCWASAQYRPHVLVIKYIVCHLGKYRKMRYKLGFFLLLLDICFAIGEWSSISHLHRYFISEKKYEQPHISDLVF